MRKAHVAAGVLAAGIVASAGYAWHLWREQQMAPIVRAAVPVIPDLASWPDEYASRVRAVTSAANRLQQPIPALTELASLYHANGLYREAQQVERGLRALEPKNAQWPYYLADTCQNLGDMEGTRIFLEETLRLAPHYPLIRLKLADLFMKQGLTDQAVSQYEWRLALVPNDPYALLGLARIAQQRGNRTEALRLFERIVRTSPEFSSAHSLLAELYAQMGNQTRAEEQRRLGSAAGRFIEANDPWLYRVYAWSFDSFRLDVQGGRHWQAHQLEDSLPFYQKTVRLAPADGAACDALGNRYLQLGRLDDAIVTLDAGLAAMPKIPELYSTLARVLLKQGHISKAVAVLQRGVRTLPEQLNLRCDLGAALQEAGRMTEARQELESGLVLARRANNVAATARFEQLLAPMATK
jgi:tetratricopeptide (TPR) repeat protein